MKQHEIKLKFTETEDESISEICRCEFCDHPIRFYRYKGWLGDNYQVEHPDKTFHSCGWRPTGWSEFGSKEIPEGWEYWRSDDDDDRACFTQKKYTRFEK